MKKTILLLLAVAGIICSTSSFAQKFITEKSFVSFYSHATMEDIKAEHTNASSIFNPETGEIVFALPIKEFKFDKALMQEHFNEKYMESEKFPKATFQGKVEGFQKANPGIQQVKAIGKLTVHGVTKEVDLPGTLEVTGNKLQLKSKFIVKLEDHSIAIPQLMWQNIAEQVEVTLEFTYKPYEK
jgi:polyisoprenoid-binding protein YceI